MRFVYIEIQSELDELNIKKIYLFDPPQTSRTKLTNGIDSGLEPVQLYEQFEACSIEPPKPIPYNPKRMSTSVEISLLQSFVLRNHRSCFLHLYIWNNRITKSSSDQTRQVRIFLPLPTLHHPFSLDFFSLHLVSFVLLVLNLKIFSTILSLSIIRWVCFTYHQ